MFNLSLISNNMSLWDQGAPIRAKCIDQPKSHDFISIQKHEMKRGSKYTNQCSCKYHVTAFRSRSMKWNGDRNTRISALVSIMWLHFDPEAWSKCKGDRNARISVFVSIMWLHFDPEKWIVGGSKCTNQCPCKIMWQQFDPNVLRSKKVEEPL